MLSEREAAEAQIRASGFNDVAGFGCNSCPHFGAGCHSMRGARSCVEFCKQWLKKNKETEENKVELKTGMKVWVSDTSEEMAIYGKSVRIYLFTIGETGRHYCIAGGKEHLFPEAIEAMTPWNYVVPVAEPDVKEYTMDEIANALGVPASEVRIKK